MEKPKPPRPASTQPEAPPQEELKLGIQRCPYCHDDLAVERDAWVACWGCQARHHEACWSEAGACGACGERRSLQARERSEVAPPKAKSARILRGIYLVSALLCVLSIIVHAGAMNDLGQPVDVGSLALEGMLAVFFGFAYAKSGGGAPTSRGS